MHLRAQFFVVYNKIILLAQSACNKQINKQNQMKCDNNDMVTQCNQNNSQKHNQTNRPQSIQNQDESNIQKQLNFNVYADGDIQFIEQKDQTNLQEAKKKHIERTYENDKNIIGQKINQSPQQSINQQTQPKEQPLEIRDKIDDHEQGTPLQQQISNEKSQLSFRDASEILEKLKISQSESIQSEGPQAQQRAKLTEYTSQPQKITRFCPQSKSKTISVNQSFDQAQQSKFYYQNCKLVLTQPITSQLSQITFRLDNLKYCLGFGVGVKQILHQHQYDYKSTTETQIGHGLYIVTTQGYSWSHSQEQEDDILRQGFDTLYSGCTVSLKLQGEVLQFKWKKRSFTLRVPASIKQTYTLCFCAYLHEKTDAMSIVK